MAKRMLKWRKITSTVSSKTSSNQYAVTSGIKIKVEKLPKRTLQFRTHLPLLFECNSLKLSCPWCKLLYCSYTPEVHNQCHIGPQFLQPIESGCTGSTTNNNGSATT